MSAVVTYMRLPKQQAEGNKHIFELNVSNTVIGIALFMIRALFPMFSQKFSRGAVGVANNHKMIYSGN